MIDFTDSIRFHDLNILAIPRTADFDTIIRFWPLLSRPFQDPDNKQYFIPDKKMAKVFGSDKMRGFGMAKHIGPHLS